MARGEGLYKRKDSRFWWACWTPPGGAQQQRSTKTTNKAAARALLARWRAQDWSTWSEVQDPAAEEPKAPRGSALTLGELQELWEREREGGYLKSGRSRWRTIQRCLKGPHRRASDVQAEELQQLRVSLARSMSRASANLHMAVLRTAYKEAVERKLLRLNPAKGLRNYAVHDARDRVMSPQEERQLMDAAKPGLARAIALAVDTGLRRGELVQLEWVYVDLERRLIELPARLTKTKRPRQVPLTPRAVRVLSALERSDRIVPYTAMSLSAVFRRLCTEVGVADLRLHDLRHTCATRMRRAGVDWFTVMRVLGHNNPKHAARYQTIAEPDLRGAADKLSRWTEGEP